MQVTDLTIRRQASYESDPGQLKGIVTMTGSSGSQTIVLSAKALSRIFGVIAQDVTDQARVNATQAKNAMEEAVHQPLLADAAEVKELS